MKKNENYFVDLALRYFILLFLGTFMFIIYEIFTPLTLHLSYWGLSLFGNSEIIGEKLILFNEIRIELVSACVAGAAYYLLLVLNLTTPMRFTKRMKSVLFLLGSFLIINVIRIVVFSNLAYISFSYFDITHLAVWYLGSTIFVVGIWFFGIWLFKIKEIPVYSDVKKIYKLTKRN
jgi:hypothetical protein